MNTISKDKTLDDVSKEFQILANDLNKFLQRIQDGLQETFDDHIKVIVTHDGIITEEYEHD